MRNRLLLVDGDPRSLRVLDVSLRSSGFDVDTATNGSEAWTMLESAAPDLIIADTDLSGIDGFELCTRLRQSALGAGIPFIFLAADKTLEQKIRALEAGANDYLVKPAYVKEVLAHVRALLQRRDRERLILGQDTKQDTRQDTKQDTKPGSVPAGRSTKLGLQAGPTESAGPADLVGPDGRVVRERFAGSIADITVVDLVQLVEGNGRSGIVHLRAANGAPASIYFRQGKVVDAEVGRLSGIDALSRLFSWQDGGFDVEWKSIRRKDAIERPSAELVIEGMERLDEWNRLREQLPDVNAVFEVDYRLLAERLAEIPDEVNGILRLCDGVRTIMQVVEDSAIPDTEALTAIIRLREEGIVYEASAGQAHERQADSTRLGGWLGAGSSPFASAPAGHAPTERMGIGSGPVQQSFADRLQVEAQETAQETGHEGAHEGADETTKEAAHEAVNIEAVERGDPPPAGVRTPDPDTEGDTSARRRRTAPGLGQSPADLSAVAQAIPEARSGQVEDNIIKFPALGVPRPGTSGATRLAAAMPASEDLASAHEDAESTAIATPEEPASLPVVPPATPTPAAMTQTHRGVGPRPPELETSGEMDAPAEVPDRGSGRVRQSGRVIASGVVASSGGQAEGPSQSVPVADRESISEAAFQAGPPVDRTGAQLEEQAVDHTVRVSFPDDEISRGDALDELGLPSRWRGFRFLIGAFVLGTLAAVGLNRFLGGKKAQSDGAAHAPVAAEGERASDGVGKPPAPSAVIAPRGPVVIPSTASAPAVALPVDPGAAATPTKPAGPDGVPQSASIDQPPAPASTMPAARPPVADLSKALAKAAPAQPQPGVGASRATDEAQSPGVPVRPAAADPTRAASDAPAAPARAGASQPGHATGAPAGAGASQPGHATGAPAGVAGPPARTAAEPARTPGARARVAAEPASPPATDGARQLADCRSAFSRDRLREAFTACTAAVAANPNSAEALTMLAHTELNRGRLARANQLAQKAVTIDPNRADAYVIIGGVHQDSGQKRDAKAAYRRYLQLAPHGRYADELRSIVNEL